MDGLCTNCGYEGRLHWGNPGIQICDNCLTRWVIETKRAVKLHRPNFKQMRTEAAMDFMQRDARIDALEREVAALKKILGGWVGGKVHPIRKTRTEAAREMMQAGKTNLEVRVALGLTSAQVSKIKYRLKKAGLLCTPVGMPGLDPEVL